MTKVNKKTGLFLLLGIFLIALIIRFLYFRQNIHFGYDQARDAFVAKEVMIGDFKIIGPPTLLQDVFHGPLFYYLFGPLYIFSKGSPELVSAFLRTYNAFGIFLVFLIARNIFNEKVAIIAAFLFAVSFEQTQYALFLGHPSLAVIAVLLFYLGLSLLFFRKDKKGIPLALLGLGLSIQFHFTMIYLFLPMLTLFVLLRKRLPSFDTKTIFISFLVFICATLTFLIAELKFNFRTTRALLAFAAEKFSSGPGSTNVANLVYISQRFIRDNIISHRAMIPIILVVLLIVFVKLLLDKREKEKIIFLVAWLVTGLIPYLSDYSSLPIYYYGIGASISLIIIVSFLIYGVFERSKLFGISMVLIVFISNIGLITRTNPKGTIPEINVQEKMLLSDEKRVIDYIYQQAGGEQFSVNALTIPFNINTTWSYLFEWYGQQRYGYLPVWGGDAADGYHGNLEIITARSQLPDKRYVILEPTRGIYPGLIKKFLLEEDYFSSITEEKEFGDFVVQVRVPKS